MIIHRRGREGCQAVESYKYSQVPQQAWYPQGGTHEMDVGPVLEEPRDSGEDTNTDRTNRNARYDVTPLQGEELYAVRHDGEEHDTW